jgi:putative component of membrane protein insertase Oxa1/YidC/SpoIIIJ protein YidD
MIASLRLNGLLLGLVAGAWRVLRCNPFNPGGFDPVQ